MSALNPTAPVVAVPQDIDDAVEMLTSVLHWLDESKFGFAAIDVNSAIERLRPTNLDLGGRDGRLPDGDG